ncbi:hypothetical protein G7054_g1167 [Neopestalotiopsis clavispora]|nr:hypothetical protein G7054_g1167 [Neopestalotiopsis clavispora]
MDHLSLPQFPAHPHVEVPRICEAEYDGGPWLSYQERERWQKVDFLGASRSADDVQSFLQRWLFFGLLHVFLGAKLDQSSFVRDAPDGSQYITTAHLPELLRNKIREDRDLDPRTKGERILHLAVCISEMDDVLTNISIWKPDVLDRRLHLAFAAVAEELQRFSWLYYRKQDTDETHPMSTKNTFLYATKYLTERMKCDGWCPFQISQLGRLSIRELYFISAMERPALSKDHGNCEQDSCSAFQIDNTNYKTKHTSPNCQCAFIFAPQPQLSDILLSSDTSYPLIVPFEVNGDAGSQPKVRFIDSTATMEYVAISHVWSDGLGNVEANAIPTCQFDRLSQLVSKLYHGKPIPFWFDTWCFPLEPQEAYNRALIRMRPAYEFASKVLVLDGYILQHDALEMNTNELLARVICSPWNQRLWTLQEGFLAKSLHFQTSNSAVNLSNSFDVNTHISFEFTNLWSFYEQLRPAEKMSAHGVLRMTNAEAKRALATRSTSVPDDEALCLGNLLGLDSNVIVRTEPKDRMRVIWQQQTEYESNIMFWPGSKLEEKGYRWAPSTLFDRSVVILTPEVTDASLAVRADEGLLFMCLGVIFSASQDPMRPAFFIHDGVLSWHLVFNLRRKNGASFGSDEEIRPSWEDEASPARQLALLMHRPL